MTPFVNQVKSIQKNFKKLSHPFFCTSAAKCLQFSKWEEMQLAEENKYYHALKKHNKA